MAPGSDDTWARWLGALSARRWAPVAFGLLAFALCLPALGAGLLGDDYFHRIVLLDLSEWDIPLHPWRDLFAFVPEQTRERMMEAGYLPWWCDPKLTIELGRPLTAFSHVLDYALWPDLFVLQHLHSLAWLAVGVGLVALLYRQVHGATLTAALAALLFAVEDAHAMPAAWLANRNALVCLSFGAATILLHLWWCRRGGWWRLAVAVTALAVGLGCGEATLGALAYVAAWQLTEEDGSWPRRLGPLVPYGLVVVAWRAVYDAAGFGTYGSTLYVDPAREPLQFAVALVERWPLMVVGQWLQAPIDLWLVLPRWIQLVSSVAAALAALALVLLFWELFRHNRLARFWALGMALALVPLCAAFPMDRLLIFSGIGGFGVIALLVDAQGLWRRSAGPVGWRRRGALALLVLHAPLAATLLVGRTAVLPEFGKLFSAGARKSPAGPEVSEQTFVFVNGNDFPVIYTRMIRMLEGSPSPRRVAQLAAVTTDNTIHREDERTLVITPRGGFLAYSLDRLLASRTRTFRVGERIDRPDYQVEVRSVTGDGRPEQAAFRFRQPLEHPSLRWLCWRGGQLREFALPEVGEQVRLPAR